jgi:hypothetical protein
MLRIPKLEHKRIKTQEFKDSVVQVRQGRTLIDMGGEEPATLPIGIKMNKISKYN